MYPQRSYPSIRFSVTHPQMSSRTALASLAPIALASFISISPSPAAAATEGRQDWTATLDGHVVWQSVTPSGVLVVGTVAGMAGLDSESGKVIWRIDDLTRPSSTTLVVLPRDPYALLRLKKGVRGKVVRVLIDVTTGREVWDSSVLGLQDVYRDLYVPSLDALLIAGKATNGKVVVAVDLESGQRIGEIAVPEKAISSIFDEPTVFDTDSTLVSVSGDRLIRNDLVSGAMTWTSPKLDGGKQDCGLALRVSLGASPTHQPGRIDPRPLLPTAPLLPSSDGQRLIAAHGQMLHALDARGQPLWRSPHQLCGRCVQLLEAGDGVLARTMPEIAGKDQLVMLDAVSGAVRWEHPGASKSFGSFLKSMLDPAPMSNAVVDSNALHVLEGGQLERIDLATGVVSVIGKTRIDETSVNLQLERDGEGFLVIGEQEIEWLDSQGKSIRHVQYAAPGDVGTAIAMLGAVVAVKMLVKQKSDAELKAKYDKFAASTGTKSIGDKVVSQRKEGRQYRNRMIEERFLASYHASSTYDSLTFMLADLDESGVKGTALVAIDKRSGETVCRVPVSKRPNLEIDPYRRRVFVADEKTIRGHAL